MRISVALDSVTCTVVAGISCILTLTLVCHMVVLQCNNKSALSTDKYISNFGIISTLLYFGRTLGLFIGLIVLLVVSTETNYTWRMFSATSLFCQCFGFIFMQYFYIRRLQVAFKDSALAYNKCTIYSLYVFNSTFIVAAIAMSYWTYTDQVELALIVASYWTLSGRLVFSNVILCLFCRKLLQLMVVQCNASLQRSNSAASISTDVDIYNAVKKSKSQRKVAIVDMDIIRCMSQYTTLIFVSTVASAITMILVLLLYDPTKENAVFLASLLSTVSLFIHSYCLYCTYSFASKQYQTICKWLDGFCISLFLRCVVCKVDKMRDSEMARQIIYKKEMNKTNTEQTNNSTKQSIESNNDQSDITDKEKQKAKDVGR